LKNANEIELSRIVLNKFWV